jgi:hypothetical protein
VIQKLVALENQINRFNFLSRFAKNCSAGPSR